MTKSFNVILILIMLINLSLGRYELIQTLIEPANTIYDVSLTSDMMLMCAGSYDNRTYIYKNDNGSFIINQTLVLSPH